MPAADREASPSPRGAAEVRQLHRLPRPSRPPEAIEADVRAELARHDAVMRALWAERAGDPSRVGGERRLTKKKAAGELNMSAARLMRLVVRYHAAHPDRPKLAVQPAGLKSTVWSVYVDRVRAVIESGEPY